MSAILLGSRVKSVVYSFSFTIWKCKYLKAFLAVKLKLFTSLGFLLNLPQEEKNLKFVASLNHDEKMYYDNVGSWLHLKQQQQQQLQQQQYQKWVFSSTILISFFHLKFT